VQVSATLVISGVVGFTIGGTGDWKVAVGLLFISGFALVGLLRPALFVGIFMLLRPLMDFQLTADVPSGNGGGVFGVLLIVVFLALVATLRKPTFISPAARGLFSIALVSLVAAVHTEVSLHQAATFEPIAEVIRLLALVAIYAITANVFGTPDKARTLFLIVALSAVVPTIWGLFELASGPVAARDGNVGRISGPFVGPAGFGAFLGLGALLLIFLPGKPIPTWVRVLGVVGTVGALAATYSRMGWVFLLVGLVVLGWRDRKAIVLTGLVALVALAVAVPSIGQRAAPFAVSPAQSGQEEGYESFNWRTENWGGLLEKWKEKPFFGHGLQSTEYVNPRRLTKRRTEVDGGFAAHNTVVKVLVEGGVVLLAFYIAFLGLLLAALRRMMRARWPLAEHSRLMFVLWLLVIMIAVGTDDPFGLTALMYAMFALTGALEGAFRSWRRDARAAGVEPVTARAGALPAGAANS